MFLLSLVSGLKSGPYHASAKNHGVGSTQKNCLLKKGKVRMTSKAVKGACREPCMKTRLLGDTQGKL